MKIKAYVRFENGALQTQDVWDGFGKFEGMDIYLHADDATKRWSDVREVEITIGKRVKEKPVEPAQVSVEEIERDLGHEIR